MVLIDCSLHSLQMIAVHVLSFFNTHSPVYRRRLTNASPKDLDGLAFWLSFSPDAGLPICCFIVLRIILIQLFLFMTVALFPLVHFNCSAMRLHGCVRVHLSEEQVRFYIQSQKKKNSSQC